MKTSNKILITVFLTVLLAITALHLAIYARYRSGNFTVEKISDLYEEHKLPKLKYVKITGHISCGIYVANEGKLHIPKVDPPPVVYRIANDTLIINGDSLMAKQQHDRGAHNSKMISLYLPSSVEIKASNTELSIFGEDSVSAPSWSVHLSNNAKLKVNRYKPDACFDHLNIYSSASKITLHDQTKINELHIQSFNSAIHSAKAKIKYLQMEVDSSSVFTIPMKGEHLKNIKFVKE